MFLIHGDSIFLEHVEDGVKSFLFGFKVEGEGTDVGCDFLVMVQKMDVEEAHTNQAHTDVTTNKAFLTTMEDVVGHVIKGNVGTTGTAH